MVVNKGVGFRYRGACEGGANPLSELDHALAMIGSAPPATRAERPVSVRSRDPRRGPGQWARRAVSGHSWDHEPSAGFDRGCVKTLKSQQGGELFSLLPFFRSRPQRYSSLDWRNQEGLSMRR